MLQTDEANDIRDDLPRVSIDSLQDWQRIQRALDSAASVALEGILKQHGLSDQSSVFIPHLMQFMDRIKEIAVPNLRVNGQILHEYTDDEQDADQFDESLDRRIWSLSDQRLKWDLELANKRRGIPLEIENLVQNMMIKQREEDADEEIGDGENNTEEGEYPISSSNLPILLQRAEEILPVQLERSQRIKQLDEDIRSLRL